MKKASILTGLVAFMALVNAGILFYFLSRNPLPQPERLDQRIVETLQLDAAQQRTFQQLKMAHHQQMIALDEEFKTQLEAYFQTISGPSPKKDSLEARLSALEKQRLQLTYAHLQAIHNLCTEPQRQQFAQLLPDILHAMAGPPKKK